MNYDRKNDTDYIEGVWGRVRYLEYIEQEAERVRQNNMLLMRQKLKIAAVLAAIVTVLTVLVFMTMGLDIMSVFIVAAAAIISSTAYEYLSCMDISIFIKKGAAKSK